MNNNNNIVGVMDYAHDTVVSVLMVLPYPETASEDEVRAAGEAIGMTDADLDALWNRYLDDYLQDIKLQSTGITDIDVYERVLRAALGSMWDGSDYLRVALRDAEHQIDAQGYLMRCGITGPALVADLGAEFAYRLVTAIAGAPAVGGRIYMSVEDAIDGLTRDDD